MAHEINIDADGNIVLKVNWKATLKVFFVLMLAIGAGVSEGGFTNRALAVNAFTGGVMSEEATATVRIVPDPTFDCTDVTGKVFDDANLNGFQDGDETGIPGARVVSARGLAATTDQHGRYHITCAIVPNEFRGSNFVMKLDDRTLPSGFRPTTRPVQVQRATRGKALRVNFGASIHRVIGLDQVEMCDPLLFGQNLRRDVAPPRAQIRDAPLQRRDQRDKEFRAPVRAIGGETAGRGDVALLGDGRFRDPVHDGARQPTDTLSGPIDDTLGTLNVEAGIPPTTVEALKAMGHNVRVVTNGIMFGGYQAIARDPETGVLTGATEMRKDGVADGY